MTTDFLKQIERPHPQEATLGRYEKMRKTLPALAVCFGHLLATAPVFGQSSFVQIYGTLNADFQYAKSDDPTPVPAGINGAVVNGTTRPLGLAPVDSSIPGQFGVSSNSSNLGFRGSEDLGGGLKAIWQLENSIDIETGGGGLGNRNSNVGLAGPWGTVFYGLWDTPYKHVTLGGVDPFLSTTAATFNTVWGSPGFNISSNGTALAGTAVGLNPNNAAAFDRRQTNTVAYWTPNFAGFSARIHYSPGEAKGSAVIPVGYTLPQTSNPWLWSVNAQYQGGPFYVGVGYEQHKDYFGTRVFTGAPNATGTSSDDWGAKAVVGVRDVLGGLSVHAVYERLKYSTDGVRQIGQVSDFRRDMFGLTAMYTFGTWQVRAGWMRAANFSCSTVGAICLDSDLGTNKYSVGLAYFFSKRTSVFGYWTLTDNGDFARFKLGSNSGPVPSGGNTTIGIGTQPTAAGLGIRHTF